MTRPVVLRHLAPRGDYSKMSRVYKKRGSRKLFVSSRRCFLSSSWRHPRYYRFDLPLSFQSHELMGFSSRLTPSRIYAQGQRGQITRDFSEVHILDASAAPTTFI